MTEFEQVKKQMIAFKKMLEGRLTHAFDETDNDNFDPMDELHENRFTLSFMGKSCKLYFGAIEYDSIITMLNTILEDYEQ